MEYSLFRPSGVLRAGPRYGLLGLGRAIGRGVLRRRAAPIRPARHGNNLCERRITDIRQSAYSCLLDRLNHVLFRVAPHHKTSELLHME